MDAPPAKQPADVPVPTSAGRSRNLAATKRTGTKPEKALRSELHRRDRRFRVDHRLDLPGGRVRPDIVFTRARVAVFVDGCFWHLCPLHGRHSTHNTNYWGPKLERNVARDAANTQALESAGWTVVRIWEHEDLYISAARVETAVQEELPADTCRAGRSYDRPDRHPCRY